MAHPQTSPRGFVAHTRVDIGANQMTGSSTALLLSGGLALSGRSTSGLTETSTSGLVLAGGIQISASAGGALTANSTTLILAKDIKINNVLNVNGNSTGILLVSGTDTAGLAGNIAAGNVQIGTNSTGATFIAVRTTGTTWKYLNVTTALPT